MYKFFICIGLYSLLVSCKGKESEQESTGYEYRGDTLIISENSKINQKIKLQTTLHQLYSSDFHASGTVKAIPSQLAEIAPPFEGRITKSYVQLGQRVKAGDPIFEISSSEFYEASKVYFQALQNKKLMEINLQRQKDLVQHGVGIQKELEDTENGYEVAVKEYEQSVATMKMFNVDPVTLNMGQGLKITSPISGEVVHHNLVIGQYIKSDTPPLAIVAELNKVWVVAQVKESNIVALQPQDKVEVCVDAAPEKIIEGQVYHISELLDEETRSVQVFVACDNSRRLLKPGMFAKVHFINLPKESILIPSSALLQTENNSYVFVKVEKGKYIKQSVKTITANQGKSLVLSGLQTGDEIVSEGGIYLMVN